MAKRLTERARSLRRRQTIHEAKLWAMLRNRRFAGYKFHRQFVIGEYIVDFCCRSKKVVIELDGSGHTRPKQRSYDRARDRVIRNAGFRVLRIWNSELNGNPDGVFERIISILEGK